MKKLYMLTLYSALITMHCLGMDTPQKAIHATRQPQAPTLKEARPLKDIMVQNVTKQIITIISKSITDPVATQQKIDDLLQNADGSVLNLISEQLYNKLKRPIIDQLVQLPLVTIPATEDYFVDTLEFDPFGNQCMVLKAQIENNTEEKLLEIYTIPNFELVKKLSLDCNSAFYSPQGKFITANKGSEKDLKITLLDVYNNFTPHQFDMQIQAQTAYSFNPQENLLITCNENGLVKLLDIATQKEITADTQIQGNYFPYIEPVKNHLIVLDVNEQTGKIENIILVSENNNQLQLHTLDVKMLEISSGYCHTALYLAKNLLALSSRDDLFIYDLKTSELLKQFHCDDSINDIAFHPSGKFIAVASHDWTARIWDIEKDSTDTPERILSVENSRHIVQSIRFSPVTDIVLSSDEFIRLWDISTQKPTLVGSAKEIGDDNPIVICPNTDQGLLFTKSSAENIWLAPTPDMFNVQQITWIYSAHWAKKSLKGDKLELYLKSLENMIGTLFSDKNELLKILLHKIAALQPPKKHSH